jgi:nucleotide-binding universal stress UspA family protein
MEWEHIVTAFLIVAGVDGSEAGRRALEWSVAEAARRVSARQPATVHAVTGGRYDPADAPQGVAIRMPDPREAAERLLAAEVGRVRAAWPDVAVAERVGQGDPADVLAGASRDADLLVLGSHGHSAAYHAVLGSVADACVRRATCPVVIIPIACHRARPAPFSAAGAGA